LNDFRVTRYALLPAHVNVHIWAYVRTHVHLGNNVVKDHSLKVCVLEVEPSTKHNPGTQERAKWKEQLINLPFFFSWKTPI